MDHLDKIISYENGDMDDEEMIAFFQELIDSGTIHHLQGHYQRVARYLFELGKVQAKGQES